jgi:hypothetical protein
MGNKTTKTKKDSLSTTAPPLSVLTRELVAELQSTSRTRADACLVRNKQLVEKMQSLNDLSSTVKKNLKSLDVKNDVPDICFSTMIMPQLLQLLDSVECCRCKIPEKQRPPPFKL